MHLPPGADLTADHVLAAVVELSPVRIGVIDRDGVFRYSSTSPAVVGKNAFELLAGMPELLGRIRHALAGNDVAWTDAPDGPVLEVRARPYRDADGEVVGVIMVGTVITAQVEAEQRYRHIVDSNMLAVMAWDDDRRLTMGNEALVRLFGYEPGDIESGRLRVEDLLAPGFEAEDERARAQLAERGMFVPFEKCLRHRDGSLVPVLIGGARYDRTKAGGVAFVLDLTEQKRREREREELQAKLLQVQKLESLGLLAGGIAHDFNNLLTAVLGGAATALLGLPPESPVRADIELAMDAARKAADLTRQMLAYSGKGHFQIKPLDLSLLVKELAALLETTLPKKVQLRVELAKTLPAIEADAGQIQQIVMNLVINGAEAIGEATGTVLVTTGVQHLDQEDCARMFAPELLQPGRYAFVEVHDTGAGMDEATQARIFDPFFSTKFTGRGLGLAAVLGIVKAHRGAIRVYSTLGRGTTFKVLFPTTDARVATTTPRRVEFEGSGLVLVVDDDPGVRGVARRMLTMFGFSVLEAENGLEARAVFANRAHEIVLVLLDMTMPVMDGEEAFRELRAIRADVPVLLTSGYNEIEATRRFVAKGLTAFLQKPFTPSDFAAKLSQLLRE